MESMRNRIDDWDINREHEVECPNCGHLNEMKEESNKCVCQECKKEFKVFVIYLSLIHI